MGAPRMAGYDHPRGAPALPTTAKEDAELLLPGDLSVVKRGLQ